MKAHAGILHKLRLIASETTGMPEAEIDTDAELKKAGLDSLAAEDEFGIELPDEDMSVRSLTLTALAGEIEGMLK